MDPNRTPKVLPDAKLDSKRRRGRPKIKWINDVENDLRKAGNRNWRQIIMDRTCTGVYCIFKVLGRVNISHWRP